MLPFRPAPAKPTEKPLSPQQAAAVAMVASLKPGFAGIIDSRAGSGKTTTLVAAVRALPRGSRVLVLTYNKAIQEEVERRVGSAATVKTYHAFAFDVLKAAGRSLRPSNDALSKGWVKANVAQANLRRAVVDAAKTFRNIALPLLSPDEQPSDGDLVRVLEDFAIRLPKNPAHRIKAVQHARQLLDETARGLEDQTLDSLEFDDALWAAARFGLWTRRWDYVFVDEAQDTNPAQSYLLAGAMVAGEREAPAPLVVVGDPFQAINGWRAAGRGPLEDVVGRVAALIGQDLTVVAAPLTVSWRCPTSHVALASLRRPIDPAPDAIHGFVEFGVYDDAPTFIQPGDTVLSRTNAPLVDLALRLLANGRSINFPGTEILQETRKLIEAVASENVSLPRLKGILADRLAKLIAIPDAERLSEHDAEIDKYSVAVRLLTAIQALDELEPLLARFMSKDANAVSLLSIHRAKGKEWDRVVLYGFEATGRKNLPDWLREQERNLSYVALTRSKKWLGFLESERGQGFPTDIRTEAAPRNPDPTLADEDMEMSFEDVKDLLDLEHLAALWRPDLITELDPRPEVERAYRLMEARRRFL